jgi:glycosyltransferase involved in cell wall biosynthesis
VLSQALDNFELIILDDGSTDDTPLILRQFIDERIHLITQQNQGLASTLNNGIRLSRGQYIARQDADDIALPERFSKQVTFLDSHPNCALVGTWAEIWQETSKTTRIHRHPADNNSLHYELLFDNPFVHSSVMIRKSALDHVGYYNTDAARQPPEDYELWSRIARQYEVANIPEVLQIYREVADSISRNATTSFHDHLVRISAENIAWAAGATIDEPEIIDLAALTHLFGTYVQEIPDFKRMRGILNLACWHLCSVEKRTYFAQKAYWRISACWMNYWELCQPNSWRGRLIHFIRKAKNLCHLVP